MPAKIGDKSVNKIMIGNKEVLKVVQATQNWFEVTINTLYTKPNTDFMVNIADGIISLSGSTGTSASGGANLDRGKWNEAFNRAAQTILDENYSISGNPNRPYSQSASDVKYFRLNKIQLRNAVSTSRSGVKIQIYDSNNNLIYDSLTYNKSVNLTSSTSAYVTFDLGTSLQLNYADYRVLAYTGKSTKTYRNVYVNLYNYDVAPGEVA